MKTWKLAMNSALLAVFICLMFNHATGAMTAPAPDALVVWGESLEGLQCGLSVISQPGSNYPFVRLRVRNVGSANVQIYDDRFPDLYVGFVTRNQARRTLPGNFQAAFDPGGLYNGTRTVTTIAPATMSSRIFMNLHFHVTDPYTVEFDGAVRLVGGDHSIPMRCGPVPFHA
jgi:hypothetical protein